MKVLFFDCATGLAADMLLAALLDLGVPKQVVEAPIFKMGIDKSLSIQIKESQSFGLRGLRVHVECLRQDASPTPYQKIKEIIDDFPCEKSIRNKALKVFRLLAEAEASVHGESIERVHFHELGCLDALIEVICICAAVEYLKPIQVVCSIPPSGSGMVKTSHGFLPVPVPVVMELAKTHQIKLDCGEDYPKGELTTPTGLALMAVLADRFGQIASLDINAFGIGLGRRTFDRPNFLRVCSLKGLKPSEHISEKKGIIRETLVVQEAWIDDATPEDLAILSAELRNAGAVDVISQPVQMKKGRQGFSVKAIVKYEHADTLRMAWFLKSTTIGIQEHKQSRWALPRRLGTCSTVFGKLGVKQVQRPDGRLTIKPEHDELVRISKETRKSLEEIRDAVFISNENFSPNEDWSC